MGSEGKEMKKMGVGDGTRKGETKVVRQERQMHMETYEPTSDYQEARKEKRKKKGTESRT